MADDPTTGPADPHAEGRDRRRRPRMRVSGRSLQHVVNAIARRGADAKAKTARAATTTPETITAATGRDTGDAAANRGDRKG